MGAPGPGLSGGWGPGPGGRRGGLQPRGAQAPDPARPRTPRGWGTLPRRRGALPHPAAPRRPCIPGPAHLAAHHPAPPKCTQTRCRTLCGSSGHCPPALGRTKVPPPRAACEGRRARFTQLGGGTKAAALSGAGGGERGVRPGARRRGGPARGRWAGAPRRSQDAATCQLPAAQARPHLAIWDLATQGLERGA